MRSVFILSIWAVASVNAHPAVAKTKAGLRQRGVDLNTYRLKSTAEYSNFANTAESPSTNSIKPANYVDAATELVRRLAPGAEFRLVDDHYVGANGVAHVNFKQTAHGLDIDNADLNVNVGSPDSSNLQGTELTWHRSEPTGKSSHMATTSSLGLYRPRTPCRSEPSRTRRWL